MTNLNRLIAEMQNRVVESAKTRAAHKTGKVIVALDVQPCEYCANFDAHTYEQCACAQVKTERGVN